MVLSHPSAKTASINANVTPSPNDHVGVWIDTQKAVIIRLSEHEPQVLTVSMDMERHDRTIKAKHHGVRTGVRVVSSEKHERTRLDEEMHGYLHSVMDAIGAAERIVVFGPAYVKNELMKALSMNARFRDIQVETTTSDRMTPNQMVAWVKRFFKH